MKSHVQKSNRLARAMRRILIESKTYSIIMLCSDFLSSFCILVESDGSSSSSGWSRQPPLSTPSEQDTEEQEDLLCIPVLLRRISPPPPPPPPPLPHLRPFPSAQHPLSRIWHIVSLTAEFAVESLPAASAPRERTSQPPGSHDEMNQLEA